MSQHFTVILCNRVKDSPHIRRRLRTWGPWGSFAPACNLSLVNFEVLQSSSRWWKFRRWRIIVVIWGKLGGQLWHCCTVSVLRRSLIWHWRRCLRRRWIIISSISIFQGLSGWLRIPGGQVRGIKMLVRPFRFGEALVSVTSWWRIAPVTRRARNWWQPLWRRRTVLARSRKEILSRGRLTTFLPGVSIVHRRRNRSLWIVGAVCPPRMHWRGVGSRWRNLRIHMDMAQMTIPDQSRGKNDQHQHRTCMRLKFVGRWDGCTWLGDGTLLAGKDCESSFLTTSTSHCTTW